MLKSGLQMLTFATGYVRTKEMFVDFLASWTLLSVADLSRCRLYPDFQRLVAVLHQFLLLFKCHYEHLICTRAA